MMSFSIEQAKDLFFDSPKVQRAKTRGINRAFSRFGAFVRTRALSMLLRKRIVRGFGVKSKVKNIKGSAHEGEPPYMHLGLIAKFLFFAMDPNPKAQGVVIGPVMLNRLSPTALQSLEHGGPSLVSAGRGKRVRQVQVRQHPFMFPALLAELPNAPKELEGCITST